MDQFIVSSNPILLLVALLLTFMASYTAIELLSMLRSSKHHSKFLLLGGSFSLGIAIWTFNFFGILAFDRSGPEAYNILVTILSLILGVAFAGMGFMALTVKKIYFVNVVYCSVFLTISLLSNYMMGMYALNYSINFDFSLLIVTMFVTSFIFLLAFMILFYSAHRQQENLLWLKPLSTIIVSGAIIEGHIMLRGALPIKKHIETVNELVSETPFVIYLVFFVSLLIIGGLIASSTLITKRLEKSDKYLRDFRYALDQSSIVAITDKKGKITYVNQKFINISQYSEQELIGRNHSIINSDFHSKEFFADLWNTIQAGETWTGEIKNRTKYGSYYWVDTTIIPFLNARGKPYQYLAIRNDITERKLTEEALYRKEKLATVGQLAAGVAHEIRNPLTSMKGYTEFLQLDEKNEERLEFLDIILDEIERVNMIVEEFMVLAKPSIVNLKRKNINPIIENVLSLLKFEAQEQNISVHFEYNMDELVVDCDENRMKQVLLNFAKNGIEAMPKGGNLFVKAFLKDSQVIISIQDTGIGIPKEQVKKLGEPFFTTKQTGNGLGLMVCFKIIESHNGTVYIESEVNKGSIFQIILPAARM